MNPVTEIESLSARVIDVVGIFLLRQKKLPVSVVGQFPDGVDDENASEAYRWMRDRFEREAPDILMRFEEDPKSEQARYILRKLTTSLLLERESDVYFLQHLLADTKSKQKIDGIISGVEDAFMTTRAILGGTFKGRK
jgi:hypothetical protein